MVVRTVPFSARNTNKCVAPACKKLRIPHSGLVYFGKIPSSVGKTAVYMCAAGRLRRTCVVASTEKSPSVFREFFEAISHRFAPDKTWNSVLNLDLLKIRDVRCKICPKPITFIK
ncbi:hypothetical protein ABEB36_015691 [Hypothenemus hampei]|uniref:Uncharacterized protein n=1 Tax=Hypothenemus hampei TaxID=57062 RepID=A0ABD1DZ15_HYPHA